MRLRIDEVTSEGKKPLAVFEGGTQPAISASVGRDLTCDLPISNDAVSRNHGKLFGFLSGWAYLDLNSTNGSWINGEKVQGQSLVALADGDYLQIADTVTRVSYETKLFAGVTSRKSGWRLFAIKSLDEGLELDPTEYEGQLLGQDGIIFEQRNDLVRGTSSLHLVIEEAELPVLLNGEQVTSATELKFKDQIVCGDFLYLVVVGDLSNEKVAKAAPIVPSKVETHADLTAVGTQDLQGGRTAQVYSAERTTYVEPERIAALKFGDRSRLDVEEPDDYYPSSGTQLGIIDTARQFFLRLTDLEKRIVLGALFFLIASMIFLVILLII